ncbi:MAG: peptidyl-prolyl cis-trans isomerase [Candidatus Omnitrophica bacterium]|nr:peptidyl-prolyl cis-trans isomerase [Candidatus Omnitrophota bacterium]MDD5081644.1 peptidyl-prolyl cis-trans isomerase [Candidatus Omnitrophota bacterium]
MNRCFILFLFVIFCFAGCDYFSLTKDLSNNMGKDEIKQIDGLLLAQVDNWRMGTRDFEKQIEAVKTLNTGADLSSPDVKRNLLQEFVNLEILAREAIAKGFDKDKDVKEALHNFKRTLLAQKMLAEIFDGTVVTDLEVEDFYESNKDRLSEPEQRKIREIVVNTDQEAKDVLIRLLQGEKFSVIARTISVADSKRQGGDLGYLTPNADEKFLRFWEVAFTTDQGTNSHYFKGDDGKYYILYVEDVKKGQTRSLDEVREDIRSALKQINADKKRQDIIDSAKSKYNIIINADLLD